MFSASVGRVVDEARKRLSDRGDDSLRMEAAGRLLILRGSQAREAATLIEAGAVVFGARATADELGFRAEAEVFPARDPRVWAVLTLHPRGPRSEPAASGWPSGPRLFGSERSGQPLRARELVTACERGAASEGVSVTVAPMPLPKHFGLILRTRGDSPPAWFALGQAWAGIERLAQRSGWSAHLRKGSGGSRQGEPFGARVEVWMLRQLGEVSSAPGRAQFQTDEWVGF